MGRQPSTAWMQEVVVGLSHILTVLLSRRREKTPSRRERPFPTLQRMYGQVKQEVRRTLTGWIHPWIPFPPCYLVPEMSNYIEYKGPRHEIWIYPHEAHCLRRLDAYVDIVTDLLRALRTDPERLDSWQQAQAQWRAGTSELQRRYAGIEERGLYMSALWPQVESDFQEAEQAWQRERTLIPLEKLSELLALAQAFLWQRMHFLLIHEVVHSVTAQSTTRRGDALQVLSGMASYDYDRRVGLHEPLRERDVALNECVTDWITQRIFRQVTGISEQSGYPAWIIEKLALVLNHEWMRVRPAVESLPSMARTCAEDLLSTIYFTDPAAVSSLREALVLVTGDRCAWEKVSRACERFDLRNVPQTYNQWLLLVESWHDLGDLFSPFLSEQERGIPAPFGALVAAFPLHVEEQVERSMEDRENLPPV